MTMKLPIVFLERRFVAIFVERCGILVELFEGYDGGRIVGNYCWRVGYAEGQEDIGLMEALSRLQLDLRLH